MTPRVLVVDDDPNILAGHRRGLRRHFDVVTHEKPAEALQEIEAGASCAVVVSDYRMPDMNGVTFLTKVRELARIRCASCSPARRGWKPRSAPSTNRTCSVS